VAWIVLTVIVIIVAVGFHLLPYLHGEALVDRKLESLQEINNEYRRYNNVILKTPDGTTQIDHILISPFGIFVIETKDYKGWIFGDAHQKQWTQSLIGRGYSSVKYQFQNPIHQNYKHVKAVQGFLGVEPKALFNVVVFVGTAEFKDRPEFPGPLGPGMNGRPERRQLGCRSGGIAGMLWECGNTGLALIRNTACNTTWYGYQNIASVC